MTHLKNNMSWMFKLILSICVQANLAYAKPENVRMIYVSQQEGIDEGNDGSDIHYPIRSLARARYTALSTWRTTDVFQILLKGGERFDTFIPISNAVLENYDPLRNTFAFVWDIDRPLLISTYGSDKKALLYSGKYTHEGGPQAAIAVTTPSSQKVTIQNIHFKRWQVCAIFTYKTKNVEILDNIIEEIGTLYFPDETVEGIYGAGALYPKNSSNVLIRGNVLQNIHNQFDMLDKMHALYMTRLSDSEVCNNTVVNASGPPLKFRRSQTHHVYVHDNAFYYTGPSQTLNQTQEGWVRYSGDAKDGCPYALVIENNIFHYPYCWAGREICESAIATKCSISNTSVCGSDACENPEKIQWIDNDFKYQWEPPKDPTTSVKVGSKQQAIDLIKIQNAPNPFSGYMNILYNLKQPGHTRIEIIDITGRHVVTLLEHFATAGPHSISWYGQDENGNPLPNGIYFYRCSSLGRFKTKKIVIIR